MIKRYDFVTVHDGWDGYPVDKDMEQADDGEYCLYEDYQKLETTNIELVKEINRLKLLIGSE